LRLVIAEDSAILQDGLTRLLTAHGHEVVAAVGDGPGVASAVADHSPDLAILDVRMPPTNTDEGLRAALDVRRLHPGVAVLVFSQYVETRYASRLFSGELDGVGYLLKDRVADVGEFLAAVDRVAGGGSVLDPEVVRQLVGASRRRTAIGEVLTAREQDVLALMAEGRSNTAIAKELVISEGAVEKHVANIFARLDLPVSEQDNRRVLAVLRYLES
jgi:DNA-binding NarL/FixJ family response regulator